MKSYYIVAYQKLLSDQELETISSLCGDIKIEWIHQRLDNNIHTAMEMAFDMNIEVCYRLLSEKIPEIIAIVAECPLYIGCIDSEFETYCTDLIELYMKTQEYFRFMDDVKEIGEERHYEFNKLFDQPSNIATIALEPFEDLILSDMEFMKKTLHEKLVQRRFK